MDSASTLGNSIIYDNGTNVGIGTTNPAYKLDVSGDVRVTGTLYAGAISGTYTGTINAVNVSAGQFGANTGGGNYSFPGNVGIGTTTPITSPGGGLHVFRSGTDAVIRVERSAGVILNIEAGTIGGAVIKTLSNHPLNLGSNGVSEILTIATSGNVGIGTTNPSNKLTVDIGSAGPVDSGITIVGNTSSFGDLGLRIKNTGPGGIEWYIDSTNNNSGYGGGKLAFVPGVGSSPVMVLTNTGNVGIGTTAPNHKLTISSSASGNSVQMNIYNPTAGTGQVAGIRFHTASGWNVMLRTNQDTAWLELTDANGNWVHRWSGGNYYASGSVGIGTTNPGGYKLYVNGDAYISNTIRGATFGFGGMYARNENTGYCLRINPITGGCSCPAGFNDWATGFDNSGADPPGGGGNDQIHICWK